VLKHYRQQIKIITKIPEKNTTRATISTAHVRWALNASKMRLRWDELDVIDRLLK